MLAAFSVKMVIFALIGGLMPAIFWLWFWLKEDKRRPEPKGLLLRAFLAGGLSVVLAFYLERAVCNDPNSLSALDVPLAFSLDCLHRLLAGMPVLFSWALIEETVKFLAFGLVILPHRSYDEPVDAMIYLITIALGFAAVENTLFLLNTLMQQESHSYFLLTGNLRFMGATILHLVSSAILGYFIGRSFHCQRWLQIISAFAGLVGATILHAVFNFFIIVNGGQHIFFTLIVLWLAAVIVIYLFERIKRHNWHLCSKL